MPLPRRTLEKMFSRELVREVRALFFRMSSLKRLLVAEPSPAAELFAAFCQTKPKQAVRDEAQKQAVQYDFQRITQIASIYNL